VERIIRPALERGEWVVCARYLDSSLAYQGAGYGNDMADLRRLQEFATGGLLPDLTLLLDVPVEVGLERTRRRAEWNRFEDTEELAFFEQVRAAYLRLAAEEPERFRVIDGSASVDEADAAIREVVDAELRP
jgi:dTMP kinase